MEFGKLIKNRHSTRAYNKHPISEEKLEKILEAAISAPSAGNLQAYKIYIIKDKVSKNKLAQAANEQKFISEASVVLVFCQDKLQSSKKYRERGEELYSLQDATIACAYAQLAAANLGLGNVWVGAFNEEEVRKIINVPISLRPIAVLPIGYPNEEPKIKPRRELKDLVLEK